MYDSNEYNVNNRANQLKRYDYDGDDGGIDHTPCKKTVFMNLDPTQIPPKNDAQTLAEKLVYLFQIPLLKTD